MIKCKLISFYVNNYYGLVKRVELKNVEVKKFDEVNICKMITDVVFEDEIVVRSFDDLSVYVENYKYNDSKFEVSFDDIKWNDEISIVNDVCTFIDDEAIYFLIKQ